MTPSYGELRPAGSSICFAKRRDRSACADYVAAVQEPLLLRHRYARPQGADRFRESVEEICREINADSLSFLSPEGLISAIGGYDEQSHKGGLCMACFDNDYPTQIDFNGEEKMAC